MGRNNYFWLLLLVILYFLGLTFQMPGEDTNLFVRELYFAFFLLIVASIGLYSIASRVRAAWLYFIVFFAITIFNTLYLYYASNAGESLTTAMVVLGLVGIVFSGKQLTKGSCCQKKKQKPEEEVKPIIVDDIEPEPEMKETSEKKSTKKTAAKKTAAKKSTAKKTTKSTAKKSTKKTAAKKTAAKKSTAKKTTKSTTKKSTKKKAAKKTAAKKSTAKKTTKSTTKKSTKKKAAKTAAKKTQSKKATAKKTAAKKSSAKKTSKKR